MQERVGRARLVTMVTAVVAIVTCSGPVGWELPVCGGVMLAIVVLGGLRIEHRRKPELWVFVTTVLNIQLWVALAAIAMGGPRTAFPCVLVAPVLMVGTRFSRRGIAVGAPISFVLVLVCTVAVDPGYVAAAPGEPDRPARPRRRHHGVSAAGRRLRLRPSGRQYEG